MSWAKQDTFFLLYWAGRCELLLSQDEKRLAHKEKLTKGDKAGVELQQRVLAAIRRELTRRQECPK